MMKSFAAVLLLVSPAVWAGPKISILGGVHQSLADPYADLFSGQSFTPSLGFQAGLELGFRLSSGLQLDVGGFYFHSKTKTELGGVEGATVTADQAITPLQLRITPSRAISFGGGGYYGFHLSTGNENDYGWLASARISMPAGKIAFVLDGRYFGGLKEIAGEKSKFWTAMFGVTFGGGK
jgi:hypothetical protein